MREKRTKGCYITGPSIMMHSCHSQVCALAGLFPFWILHTFKCLFLKEIRLIVFHKYSFKFISTLRILLPFILCFLFSFNSCSNTLSSPIFHWVKSQHVESRKTSTPEIQTGLSLTIKVEPHNCNHIHPIFGTLYIDDQRTKQNKLYLFLWLWFISLNKLYSCICFATQHRILYFFYDWVVFHHVFGYPVLFIQSPIHGFENTVTELWNTVTEV